MSLGGLIYVVIWDDRHSDPSPFPFTERDVAIEWARAKAKEYDRFGDYSEQVANGTGQIFRATYSCEGDSLTVHEVGLDKEKS